jgi:hypothetical protein
MFCCKKLRCSNVHVPNPYLSLQHAAWQPAIHIALTLLRHYSDVSVSQSAYGMSLPCHCPDCSCWPPPLIPACLMCTALHPTAALVLPPLPAALPHG